MAGGRRRTGTIFIIVALILIIALALFYFLYFRNQQTGSPEVLPLAPSTSQTMVPVVITTQSISRGAIITADVLTTVELPADKVPQDLYFKDINDVIGMRAKYDLDAQLFLTKNLVTESAPGSKTAFLIDPGKTAVSIPINSTTAVNFATQPGDHVMVIGCFLFIDIDPTFQSRLPNYTADVRGPAPATEEKGIGASSTITAGGVASSQGRFELDQASNQPVYVVSSETPRPRLVCQTIIADAAVLRLGKFPVNQTDETAVQPIQQVEGQTATEVPPDPDSVTVVVTPQDAVVLYYLMQSGANLNLAMRSAGDSQQVVTEPVTLQFIMDQRNVPLPAKLPYAFNQRQDDLILTFPRGVQPTAVPVKQTNP